MFRRIRSNSLNDATRNYERYDLILVRAAVAIFRLATGRGNCYYEPILPKQLKLTLIENIMDEVNKFFDS